MDVGVFVVAIAQELGDRRAVLCFMCKLGFGLNADILYAVRSAGVPRF